MIIVQLKGGLGNQLFQYAAALNLGKHHNVPVKVDISLLTIPDALIGTKRAFDLLSIQHSIEVANEAEINAVKGNKLMQQLQKFLPSYKRNIYKEVSFNYDHYFLESINNIYLKGYRQSEKYFESITNEIKKTFVIKEELIKEVSNLASQIQSENSVSIHIRRGDYTNAEMLEYHGIQDVDYYNQAISFIKEKISNPKFYIFSDNINWVQENLYLNEEAQLITINESPTSITDFHLMSCCKHNIIANSTFSWWAAYLNPNPNKIIIAPKRWFNKANYDTKDLIPSSWIQL
jgi:hypothetical protein